MQLIDKVLSLVSKLPPSALETLVGVIDALLKAKSPSEAEQRLKAAALAVGLKAGWRETVKAKGAVRKANK